MSEPSKDRKNPKIEELELHRETVADLTPEEAENAKGGVWQVRTANCNTVDCEPSPGGVLGTQNCQITGRAC